MLEGMTTAAPEPAVEPTIEAQTETPVIKDEPIDLDAPETPEPTEGAEGSTQEGEEPTTTEGEGEQSTEEPGFVEIEIDGKPYQVPAELKDGYLRQADYTRKTQEVAAQRQVAETLKAEAEAVFNVSQEVLEARAYKLNLDSQLKQFQEINWDQLESEDPIGAQSAWRRYQQLQQQAQQVDGYLNTQQAQRAEQMERETANRLRETAEFAKTKIPGWTPEMDAKIVTFVEELGIPRDQIVQAINPKVYQLMHLAYLGSQSLAKQQTPPRPAAPTQPLKTVSAKASPAVSKDPESMSMEEYAAFRNSQKRNF
jgi:hypothetical protein